ncbi:hypothetical protein NXY56_000075 [Leishmania guyanensis]
MSDDPSAMLSSSPVSFNGVDSDASDARTALAQVRQLLAERRKNRFGVAAGAAAPVAAAASARPLLSKSSKSSSHRSSLSVDRAVHGDGNSSSCDDMNNANRQRRQAPGFPQQHGRRRPPSAPDNFLSHGTNSALASLSSSPSSLPQATTSALLAVSKPSAMALCPLPSPPPSRHISYYGGFLPHTLDSYDLAVAVFPPSGRTDTLRRPSRSPSPALTSAMTATEQSGARSSCGRCTPGCRERAAATGRPNMAFDEALAAAMVSTAERMLESDRRNGSAAPQQPCRRYSLPTRATVGSAIPGSSSSSSDASGPALMTALRGSPKWGPRTPPSTSRDMAAFGHTTPDLLIAADGGDSKGGNGVGPHCAMATGLSRHHNRSAGGLYMAETPVFTDPSLSLSTAASQSILWNRGTRESSPAPPRIPAPRENECGVAAHDPDTPSRQSPATSALSDMAGRPVSRDYWVRGLSATSSGPSGRMMVTASSRTAGVAEKDAAPQLSHHQLTEAFYGSYKGSEMAQDAYRYFVAQQQQMKHPVGVNGSTTCTARCWQSGSVGTKRCKGGTMHQQWGPSATRKAAPMMMPTRTAAARGADGCTAQLVLVPGKWGSQPRATTAASATSLMTAAAIHAAPTQLEPPSISTEVLLPALRQGSGAAAAERQQHHSQPKTRSSITSLGSVHSDNGGNGHDTSSPLSPPKLSATVRSAASTPTATKGAGGTAIDSVADQRRRQSRLAQLEPLCLPDPALGTPACQHSAQQQQQQPLKTSAERASLTVLAMVRPAPDQDRAPHTSSFSIDEGPRDTKVNHVSAPVATVATDRVPSLLRVSVSLFGGGGTSAPTTLAAARGSP